MGFLLCCLLYEGENTPPQRVVGLHMPLPLVGICAELRIKCERPCPDHTDGGKVSILRLSRSQLSIVVRAEHRPNAASEVFNNLKRRAFSLCHSTGTFPHHPPCHGAFAKPPIKASQSHTGEVRVVPITLRVSPFGRERCFKCPSASSASHPGQYHVATGQPSLE